MQNNFWRYLPAGIAHKLAPLGISFLAHRMPEKDFNWDPFQWKGLSFRNPMGIAGGVDKNGLQTLHWQKLGAGFLEVGTVTPYSQSPNSGKILDRDWKNQNLWNKMGFPNHGADEVYFNLLRDESKLNIPLFVNIGKNRQRPNEEAEIDYLYLAERFAKIADALVVNLSSPNTSGLRSLQSPQFIQGLFKGLKDSLAKVQRTELPIFLKLSPDMSGDDFIKCLEAGASQGAQGFILTNTTLSRPQNCSFPLEGGLSGKDLRDLSRKHLDLATQIIGKHPSQYLIISTGGVDSLDEVQRRRDQGAHLVQMYSGLVFKGPKLMSNIIEESSRIRSLQIATAPNHLIKDISISSKEVTHEAKN